MENSIAFRELDKWLESYPWCRTYIADLYGCDEHEIYKWAEKAIWFCRGVYALEIRIKQKQDKERAVLNHTTNGFMGSMTGMPPQTAPSGSAS